MSKQVEVGVMVVDCKLRKDGQDQHESGSVGAVLDLLCL